MNALDDFMQLFSWRSSLSRALDFLNKLFLPGVPGGLTWVIKKTFNNVNSPLPVKIIYLENLMLETMNCAMKTVA